MRKLTVRRKRSFVGCALKVMMSVVASDRSKDCGKLKNGKSITVDVPDTEFKVELSTCGVTMRFAVPAGTDNVFLFAKPIIDPSNPFIITVDPTCENKAKTPETKKTGSGDFGAQIDAIAANLRDYMKEDEDCGYEERHVNRLNNILVSYLSALKNISPADDAKIKELVKNTVLQINELEEDTDHVMIETDEREDICALINSAAVASGYSTDEDITEEWREW